MASHPGPYGSRKPDYQRGSGHDGHHEDIERKVLKNYEIIQKLGKGAYGVVWKAVDKRSGEVVAVKKCFDCFRNDTDAQRTYREVSYLQALNGHDNIIRLQRVIQSDNIKDIYLCFDHMETDLHVVIRAGILQDVHKKFITWQLLKALKFLHSAELIHRDIKPSNILLNSDCHIKLCDFGLCRSVADIGSGMSGPVLTDYLSTRWYRAPEIIFGSKSYTKGVDIWAVGTIVGEMINGRPVFPGVTTMNQIERILEVTHIPSSEDIHSIQSIYAPKLLSDIANKKLNLKSLPETFPSASPEALDVIKLCLRFNPNTRPSARELLGHYYTSDFHDEEEEPVYPHGAVNLIHGDNVKLSADMYRTALYEEIAASRRLARTKLGPGETMSLEGSM